MGPKGRFRKKWEHATDDGKDGGGSAVVEHTGEVASGVGEQLEDRGDLPLVGCRRPG